MQENITPQINLQDQVEETDSSQNNQKKMKITVEIRTTQTSKKVMGKQGPGTEQNIKIISK